MGFHRRIQPLKGDVDVWKFSGENSGITEPRSEASRGFKRFNGGQKLQNTPFSQ